MRNAAVLMLLLLMTASNAVSAVTVVVDGKPLNTSPSPAIHKGRVYVPVISIRKVGLWVDWRPDKRHAEVAWPESDYFIDYTVGRVWIEGYTPGAPDKELAGDPFVRGGELMVPLRSIAGSTFVLEWSSRTRTVNVHRDKHWLKWRMGMNEELIKTRPDRYETPI